jgi:hypothetical protein
MARQENNSKRHTAAASGDSGGSLAAPQMFDRCGDPAAPAVAVPSTAEAAAAPPLIREEFEDISPTALAMRLLRQAEGDAWSEGVGAGATRWRGEIVSSGTDRIGNSGGDGGTTATAAISSAPSSCIALVASDDGSAPSAVWAQLNVECAAELRSWDELAGRARGRVTDLRTQNALLAAELGRASEALAVAREREQRRELTIAALRAELAAAEDALGLLADGLVTQLGAVQQLSIGHQKALRT